MIKQLLVKLGLCPQGFWHRWNKVYSTNADTYKKAVLEPGGLVYLFAHCLLCGAVKRKNI